MEAPRKQVLWYGLMIGMSAVSCAFASTSAVDTGSMDYWDGNLPPKFIYKSQSPCIPSVNTGTMEYADDSELPTPYVYDSTRVELLIAGTKPIDQWVIVNSTCATAQNHITLTVPDYENTNLDWTLTVTPTKGTVTDLDSNPVTSLHANEITLCYKPDAGKTGTDTFTIQAEDSCSGLDDIQVIIDIQQNPAIASWYSTTPHGTGSTIIPISITGTSESSPTIEPRIGGIRQLSLDFNMPVTTGAEIDSQGIEMLSAGDNQYATYFSVIDYGSKGSYNSSIDSAQLMPVTVNGSETTRLQITFGTPITGNKLLQIRVVGNKFSLANNNAVTVSGTPTRYVRVLEGDASGDGVVNLNDVAIIRANNRAIVSESNSEVARYDVNEDGQVNLIDMAMTRSLIGQ